MYYIHTISVSVPERFKKSITFNHRLQLYELILLNLEVYHARITVLIFVFILVVTFFFFGKVLYLSISFPIQGRTLISNYYGKYCYNVYLSRNSFWEYDTYLTIPMNSYFEKLSLRSKIYEVMFRSCTACISFTGLFLYVFTVQAFLGKVTLPRIRYYQTTWSNSFIHREKITFPEGLKKVSATSNTPGSFKKPYYMLILAYIF